MPNCVSCFRPLPEGAVYCCFCRAKQSYKPRSKTRGNGQGSAYQRGKTWTARWTESIYVDSSGKLHQVQRTKGGFSSKRAALAYAAAPAPVKPKAPTLRMYYQTYLSGEFQKLSSNRQIAVKKAFDRLSPLADTPIDSLSIGEIQSVIDSNASSYYTKRDMKTLLSHCYNLAIAERATTINLSKYITLPTLEEEEPVPFKPEDIQSFWQHYPQNHFIGFILLMIYTGMMPGELLKLKIDMIDFEQCEIKKAGIKTKKRKTTPMVFPEFLSPVLHQLISESLSKIGNFCPINKDNFYSRYYAALEEANVQRLPPYACRHTTATALALSNVAPSVIQEVMRHTKFTTTQRYIHPDTESMSKAVNQLPSGMPDENV